MQAGKVKWFNNAKGYGFIVSNEDVDKDLFAHYSAIQRLGLPLNCGNLHFE